MPRSAISSRRGSATRSSPSRSPRRSKQSSRRGSRRNSGALINDFGYGKTVPDTSKLVLAIKRDDWQDCKKTLSKHVGKPEMKSLMNKPNARGVAPLHIAVEKNSKNCVKQLLQYGCETDTPTKTGATSLHLACQKEYTHLIRLLMRHGIDSKVKDSNGKFAWDMSKRSLHFRKIIQDCLEQRNHPPEIHASIPDQSVHVGVPFSFTFADNAFIDEDGDVMTYSSFGAPGNLIFKPEKREFFGVASMNDCSGHKDSKDPTHLWSKNYKVSVYAADQYSMAMQGFNLLVYTTSDVEAPFVKIEPPDQIAHVGKDYKFQIPAGTFSQEGLEFEVSGQPGSLAFDPKTATLWGECEIEDAKLGAGEDSDDEDDIEDRRVRLERLAKLASSAETKRGVAEMDQTALLKSVVFLQGWYRGYLARKRMRDLIAMAHAHKKGEISYVYTISVVGRIPNVIGGACSTSFDLRVVWMPDEGKQKVEASSGDGKSAQQKPSDVHRTLEKRRNAAATRQRGRIQSRRTDKNSPMCENCEEAIADVFCEDCDMHLCNTCDADFHAPKKMQTHRRVLLGEDMMKQKSKSHGDYAKHGEGGEDIARYEIEDKNGFYYMYQNHNATATLEEILELTNVDNLVLAHEGLGDAKEIRIRIPPGQSIQVHFKKINPTLASSVNVLQHISITKTLPDETEATIERWTEHADFADRAKTHGEKEDYSDIQEEGKQIFKYSYKHKEGYCFLYVNESDTMQLVEQLEFTVTNLKLCNTSDDSLTLRISVEPKETKLVELETIQKRKGFTLEVASGSRIKKSKKVWA